MGQSHHHPIPSSLRELLAFAEREGLPGRYQAKETMPNYWLARVLIFDAEFTGRGSDRRAALNRAAENALEAAEKRGYNPHNRVLADHHPATSSIRGARR